MAGPVGATLPRVDGTSGPIEKHGAGRDSLRKEQSLRAQ